MIVSPALADANNGNWQTARRWRQMLSPTHRVRIASAWPDAQADRDDVMLALHARRSAASVRAWADAKGTQSLALALTGTDLYRDITQDAQAQQSLALAGRLVVLQPLGLNALPERWRDKASVIFQSTTMRQTLPKSERHLRAVVVGHLRAVKSPQTVFAAARLLSPDSGIRIDHIGAASEPGLGDEALAVARECPHYRWRGALPHEATRRAIQRAHVLLHTSEIEGGAHVIMEAVCSGTPVLASRVDGNVGMLGHDYEGYFEHGDAAQLVALLEECRKDDLLEKLRAQCELRRPVFNPEVEREALLRLVEDLGVTTGALCEP